MAREEPKRIRLHKYLARCGAASRRECEKFIEQGRVQVDGVVVRTLGSCIQPGHQVVRLDGEAVKPEKHAYYLVHKPKGVICSNAESFAPERVVDLIRDDHRRLYLAGRLDVESEGLVFVTNDGDLANRLAHPRHGVPKTYRVIVRGSVPRERIEGLRRGVFLAEGKVLPSRVRVLGMRENSTELEVVISEGRNREIRRIFARIGHPVKKLTRVAIGPFHLGKIPKGRVQALSASQVQRLFPEPKGDKERGKPKRSKRNRRGK